MTHEETVVKPRRIFEDFSGIPALPPLVVRTLSDAVVQAFAEPVMSSGSPELDLLLPQRGIVPGSMLEIFGPAGCGKSALTAQFVRELVSANLSHAPLSSRPQHHCTWIVTCPSLKRLVAATVRDIASMHSPSSPSSSCNTRGALASLLQVVSVSTTNELLSALDTCLQRAVCSDVATQARRSVVVIDSIYSVLLGDDMQFGSQSGTGGGVGYAHSVGSIRRVLRNLAAANAAVWVVNGATSSSAASRMQDDHQHRLRAMRPYGGVLWYSTADVSVEMALVGHGKNVHEGGEEEEEASDDAAQQLPSAAKPRFTLFRPSTRL